METENKLECCAFIQVFIVFPPPHFYCFSLLLLLISIVFPPSPPSHFYCFSLLFLLISTVFASSSSSSFLLFSLPVLVFISIVFPSFSSSSSSSSFYCFLSFDHSFHFFFSTRFYKRLPTAIFSSL